MSIPTTEAPPAAEEAPATDEQSAIPSALTKFSGWVHVGPGADACDDVCEDVTAGARNDCTNPLHFHAYCRLPNQFQHDRIREKALAAKGRKMRQLRDPATDAHDALEGALDQLADRGDEARDEMIEELIAPTRWQRYLEATKDVLELEGPPDPKAEGDESDDDEEAPKLYASASEDQTRLMEIEAMPEVDQPVDEREELRRHVKAYADAVEGRERELSEPHEQALRDLDVNALIDRVRANRIRVEASQEFMSTYARWMWATCTLRLPGGPRRFDTPDEVEAVDQEVYLKLKEVYDDLEELAREVQSGN